ncbi:NAD(P)/FAD-dependent oxidoreductase [Sphingomonas sp. FW199]|uniref:NAD(P)/FAD-dependent oxidoreductase n=1 Tax=Sphingomonas sp. FW199 TaxID=3400217 RepID=UPI003CF3F7F5
MRRTGALILGGGPAGCAAAIRLGTAGHAVTVVERRRMMDEGVCGGFLGPDGMAALAELGIAPAAIDARPIRAVRVSDGRHSRAIALPFTAHGISRAVMDTVLMDRAQLAGADVRTGVVRSLDASGARLASGEQLAADAIMLATGKHGLRGSPRRADATGRGAVGLRWTIRPDRTLLDALDGMVDLIPFRHGYAGVLLRGDGTANVCLSVAQDRLRDAGGTDALLSELASEQPGFAALLDRERLGPVNSVADVPYGWRARRPAHGAYRLGDQAAVIASIVGDGMAIALNSGVMAANALIGGGDSATFQSGFARTAQRPLAIAQALRWGTERPMARRALFALAGIAPGWVARAAAATRIVATPGSND